MCRVGHFEKVSLAQFTEAIKDAFCVDTLEAKEIYDTLQHPKRGTIGSAGYDFYSPVSFELKPGETVKIPTGIRVVIDGNWFLMCVPRSSLGCTYRLQLDNTVGVIDSDYCVATNEGHIYAQITNDSRVGKTMSIQAGDRFMQCIFVPYGLTYDDKVTGTRNGGFGSTGA